MSAFTLRPDQKRALRNLHHHFVTRGETRGKYISACGTGKTVVLSHLPEILQAKTVVFLVPSLNLVTQTWQAFDRQLGGGFDGFIVCSDDQRSQATKTAGEFADDAEVTEDQIVKDLGRGEVLRKPAEIADRLDRDPVLGPPTIVFCTYQSSHLLRQGVDLSTAGEVDLMICDEAHRLASENVARLRSNTAEALTYPPRLILSGNMLKAKRRIFATATPRSSSTPGAYSMEDARLFGRDAHVYTYAEAVLDRVVAPFDIVVSHLDADADGSTEFLGAVMPTVKKPQPGETAQSIIHHDDVRSKIVAHTVTDLRRAGTINRVMTYASRVARAKQNARDINAIEPGAAQSLSSRDSTKRRIAGMEKFVDGSVPVMTNCQLFGEGHDTPTLDAVAFVDPKNSVTDIAQAIGRAARIPVDPVTGAPAEDKRAMVILPVDSFTYDQSGVMLRRKDGKAAIDVKAAQDNAHGNPFAIIESVLNALDTPGVALYETAGDFRDALQNRPAPRHGVQPRRYVPETGNSVGSSPVPRERVGYTTEQLVAKIGPTTPAEQGRIYTEAEITRALPKLLSLDVLGSSAAAHQLKDEATTAAAISRYIAPKRVDKREIFDFSLPANVASVELGRQYAESDLLGEETPALLYRAIEALRSPITRRAYCAATKGSSAQTGTLLDRSVFTGVPAKVAAGDEDEISTALHQLRQGLAYSLYLAEYGTAPSVQPAESTRLHREAKRAHDVYQRRAQRDWSSQTEKKIAHFAGFTG